MSLNWEWNAKVGEAKFENADRKEVYSLNLYQGNALLILIYEFTEEGKEMYQVSNFFCDEEHAKRCLGISKDAEDRNIWDTNYWRLQEITLYKDMMRNGQAVKLADLIHKAKFEKQPKIYITYSSPF